MIRINSTPFESSSLAAKYSAESVEAQLLTKLSASEHTYDYASQAELEFELKLRAETVQASLDLNESRLKFAVFEDATCNPAYWERTRNGGFRLKDGVKGSAAITDIYANGQLYGTECATGMMIVYYKALLEALGTETFDRLFTHIYLMNWTIREPLLSAVGTPQPVAEMLLGDRAYFANPDVDPEVPWWQGENVIVLPNDLFYGHGVGIQNSEAILRHLNNNRKRGATTEAYLMERMGRPDYPRIYQATQAPVRQRGPLSWQAFPAPVGAGV